MTSVEKNVEAETEVLGAREWVKPEITSFEVVSATQAATSNPGDGTNSNS
jgi:hypothetical protein